MYLNTYKLQYDISGGHFGNEYDVDFVLPAGFGDVVEYPRGAGIGGFLDLSSDASKMNVLCKAVTLPGATMSTSEFHYRGTKYKIIGEEDNAGEFDIEFYNDKDLTTRRFFENWLKAMRDRNSGQEQTSDYIYTGTVMVTTSGKKAIVTSSADITYSFGGAFPTKVSDLSLDGTNVSELTTTTVTFAYSTQQRFD